MKLSVKSVHYNDLGVKQYYIFSVPGSVVPPIPLGIQSSQSDTEIVVTWQAPSDASIEGYILSYGVGAPTEYRERFPSTQTEFTITDLIPDTAYVLSLKAFNQVGEGPALYLQASTVQQSKSPDYTFKQHASS